MKLKIYGAMIVILMCIGIYCGYKYSTEVMIPEAELDEAAEAQDALFEEIRQSFSDVPAETSRLAETSDGSAPQPETAEKRSAAVAWLKIPGTHIDYPIAQAEDNEFYLYRGIDGNFNQKLGCPFLDCRCESDFSGFNSIVYAHHMTKQRMFADIALYQDEAFMQSCPTGELTLADGVHSVDFFAYLTVPSTAELYEVQFDTAEDRNAYIEYIYQTAKYHADADVHENSRLLLLSTCTYEYEEARGVLVGVIAQEYKKS